jgi:hypothetical protein
VQLSKPLAAAAVSDQTAGTKPAQKKLEHSVPAPTPLHIRLPIVRLDWQLIHSFEKG